jgi:hypothetical protein
MRVFIWAVLLSSMAISAWAGVDGSISGTVTDPSGGVIPKATVRVTSRETGIRQTTITDDKGFYSFPSVPVGHYELEIENAGFKPYRRTGVVIDANSALTVDATLDIGARTDVVTIAENELHVDTTRTAMGQVITSTQMSAVPLNGRSFTDLLALQPGIAPVTSITSETVQDVGASALSPSGDLNPGTISINGQREFANAFIVNGSDVEEDVNMGTAVVPNLDSIAEFRILTNNFDAEYGEFSGGQINVVTKSGSDEFHGDVFEFLRNTGLDARNYFSPARGEFDQNQFGGTFGGPIRRNKVFFFGDYQGTRLTQGIDTPEVSVPSQQDRLGNLSDLASSFATTDANGNRTPTTVSGPYWASLLSQKLGYEVIAGEPYYYTAGETIPGSSSSPTGRYASNCTTTSQCVLPALKIPSTAWSAPATNLLQYIPTANNTNGTFSTSAFDETLRDDKGAYRLDANNRLGLMSAYYFFDDWSENNPYPVAQGGANVPGFNALYTGRSQLLDLGDTKMLHATAVNEFHFSYMRDANDLGKPVGGVGVSLASQGFEVGQGTPGIVALSPNTEGVESVGFNSYAIGTNTNQLNQTNNTFQWLDNFSKVLGTHTVKFGGEFHYDQVNVNPIAQFNGSFLFFGTETGSDFADFLLGIPTQYNQSQLQAFYGRNKYTGLYGQDSWRVARGLTLNYGLRWDRIEPWYEKYNQIATFIPGEQSVVFPDAPAGILYPTDPRVPRTLAPPGNLDFAPRIGLAYSPSVSGNSVLARLFGRPGKTSIRASYGMFYTAI